jgi:hypothetical protein
VWLISGFFRIFDFSRHINTNHLHRDQPFSPLSGARHHQFALFKHTGPARGRLHHPDAHVTVPSQMDASSHTTTGQPLFLSAPHPLTNQLLVSPICSATTPVFIQPCASNMDASVPLSSAQLQPVRLASPLGIQRDRQAPPRQLSPVCRTETPANAFLFLPNLSQTSNRARSTRFSDLLPRSRCLGTLLIEHLETTYITQGTVCKRARPCKPIYQATRVTPHISIAAAAGCNQSCIVSACCRLYCVRHYRFVCRAVHVPSRNDFHDMFPSVCGRSATR